MTTEFGPTALVTPANAVTIARVAATPLLITVILASGDSWPALGLWVVLAGTDGLDGFLARRQGSTRSGAFLDPLADKILVLSAMAALIVEEYFWWVPVALIAAREAAVSVYRLRAGQRGVSIPARPLAKAKTVVQSVAVGFALLPPTAGDRWVANSFLWLAVGLTIWSGAQYLQDHRFSNAV